MFSRNKVRDDWPVQPGDLPAPDVLARVPQLAGLEHNAIFRLLNRRRKRQRWLSPWTGKFVILVVGISLIIVICLWCFDSTALSLIYGILSTILLVAAPGDRQKHAVKSRVVGDLTHEDCCEIINTNLEGCDYINAFWGLELHPLICKRELRKAKYLMAITFLTCIIPMQSYGIHFIVQLCALACLSVLVRSFIRMRQPEMSAFRSAIEQIKAAYESWYPGEEDKEPTFYIGPKLIKKLPIEYLMAKIAGLGCMIISIAVFVLGVLGVVFFLKNEAAKYISQFAEYFGILDKTPGNEPVFLAWIAMAWPFFMVISAVWTLSLLRHPSEKIDDYPDFESFYKEMAKTMEKVVLYWRRSDPFEPNIDS